MINKIPHFLQDHKKIIRSVWYSSYACCDLLKIEIYPQANHAPISFRIYSGTGGGGDVFRATVSKTLSKSVAEHRFVGVFYCVLI